MSDGSGSFCSACGSSMPDGAQFCAKCGASTGVEEIESSEEVGSGSTPSAKDQPPKRRKKWLVLAAGVVAVLAAVTVIASTVLSKDSVTSDYVLLGEPQRDDSGLYDLYLVQAGAEADSDARIARDVRPESIEVFTGSVFHDSSGHGHDLVELPSGDMAVGYADDDMSVVEIGAPSDWDATRQVLDSSDRLSAYFETGTDALVVNELDSDSERCYVFGPGEDADRIVRSNYACRISLTLGVVFVLHEVSDGEQDATVSDLEGNELAAMTMPQNADGAMTARLLFYVDEARSSAELVAVEWQSGTEIGRSRSFESIEILDSVDDVALFVGDDGDGSLALLTLDGTGTVREVAEAIEVEALLSDDGGWVFYAAADDEGEWELFAASLVSEPGAAIDLDVDGRDISGLTMNSLPTEGSEEPFLVVQAGDGDEVDVYGGSPTGGMADLYSYSGGHGRSNPGYAGSHVYLEGAFEDPSYIYDMTTETLVEVDGRWDRATWVDVSEDGAALLLARDDEEDVLYYVPVGEDPDPVELDAADSISMATFSSDGKTVWYSVEDRGDDEVRQATLSDDPQVETVYEDTSILGTAWQRGLKRVTKQSSGASAFIDPVAEACRADGLAFIEYGTTKTVSAGYVSGTHDTCVTLREETVFEVQALANNGVDLTMSVEAEQQLGYNDDANDGTSPYLNLGVLPRGTYRVRVGSYDLASWTAEYDLLTGPPGG